MTKRTLHFLCFLGVFMPGLCEKSFAAFNGERLFSGAPFSLILPSKISENGAPEKILFSGISRQMSGQGLFTPPPAKAATISVMTFNIRYPNPGDGTNFWPNRKALVASMVRFHSADLIGVQEAFRSQLDELGQMLPEFAWTGVCRTDGSMQPRPDNEFSAIFYRKDRFKLLDGQTFWLSETPDQAGSKGWDAALPRIVTWAKFKDLYSGDIFYHFNTHFDHQGNTARRAGASLLLQKIQEIAGVLPAIVTGDFNARPEDPPIQILTDPRAPLHLLDAFHVSETPHHGPDGTWTDAFQTPGVPGQRIDYIFVKKGIRVLRHGILSDTWSGRLPSDHLPVLAQVVIHDPKNRLVTATKK